MIYLIKALGAGNRGHYTYVEADSAEEALKRLDAIREEAHYSPTDKVEITPMSEGTFLSPLPRTFEATQTTVPVDPVPTITKRTWRPTK